MDVRLSPEQLAVRDAAARVVDRLGPGTMAGLDDTDRAEELDAAAEASGWRALRQAVGDGTPLASGVEVAIVAEELGRGLADTPFLGPVLAAELRRMTSAPASSGRETIGLGVGLEGLATAVDGVLPGAVTAVDARNAGSALVLTSRSDDTSTIAEVAVPRPTVEVDLTRPSATWAPVHPPTDIAGQSRPLTATDLRRWLSLGLAITCADLVGTMRGALELARAYAGNRQQFGVHIGSFQAVQHLLADAHVAMEGSRSVALHAAWVVDARPPDGALVATSMAKAYCARAARQVCEIGIQVHGGIGNTWECLAHVYLRRALLSGELFGGVDANLARTLASVGLGGDRGLR
jgi:alkylation response protein AidB-like acyl-CoA dehydrogenase